MQKTCDLPLEFRIGRDAERGKRDFIEAARVLGAGSGRIILRYIIPNLTGPVIAYATLTVPAVMLEEAFLSFPGIALVTTLFSLNLLGDGLREAFDPRARGRR